MVHTRWLRAAMKTMANLQLHDIYVTACAQQCAKKKRQIATFVASRPPMPMQTCTFAPWHFEAAAGTRSFAKPVMMACLSLPCQTSMHAAASLSGLWTKLPACQFAVQVEGEGKHRGGGLTAVAREQAAGRAQAMPAEGVTVPAPANAHQVLMQQPHLCPHLYRSKVDKSL